MKAQRLTDKAIDLMVYSGCIEPPPKPSFWRQLFDWLLAPTPF